MLASYCARVQHSPPPSTGQKGPSRPPTRPDKAERTAHLLLLLHGPQALVQLLRHHLQLQCMLRQRRLPVCDAPLAIVQRQLLATQVCLHGLHASPGPDSLLTQVLVTAALSVGRCHGSLSALREQHKHKRGKSRGQVARGGGQRLCPGRAGVGRSGQACEGG